MKKKMFKLISLLVCLCLTVTAVCVGAYAEGKTIEYGEYPQTLVSDEATVNALNGLDADFVSYGYFYGSGGSSTAVVSDYMRYADVELDGAKYRGVVFDNYRPYFSYKPNGSDASYQKINGYEAETVYWFRYEPISWKILDEKTGFAVSEKVLDAQAFCPEFWYDGSNGGEYYSDSTCSALANDFSSASVSGWLDGDFASAAFDSEELSGLIPAEGQTVTLLSSDETALLSGGLTVKGTDYAKCQGLYVGSNSCSAWLLRDAGEKGFVKAVSASGSADKNQVYCTFDGIRPAVYIDSVIPRYTVKWNTGTGTVTEQHKEGDALSAPELEEREGMSFKGWNKTVPAKMPAGNLEFTAKWENNQYNVTWHMNGTDVVTKAVYGSPIIVPRIVEKEGARFDGWDKEIPAKMPAGDLEFTAIYTDVVVTGIKVASKPTKTSYYYKSASAPDLSGLTLEITYSDGVKKTVTDISGVKTTGFDTASVGAKTVKVEYEGFTADFTVNVSYAWWQMLIRILLLGFLWY